MMHRRNRLFAFRPVAALTVALSALALPTIGAAGDEASHPVLQTAHPTKIVTINVPDAARLSWLLDEVGVNPLACRPGPGLQTYHASVEQLEQINRAGLRYTVEIDDADAAFLAERARIEAHNQDRGANWFDDYKTFAQIEAKVDELAALRPDLVTKLTVGTTHEGRTIFGMRISSSATTKPAVLFNGCQHAREWISPMTVMWIANELVTREATDPDVQNILSKVEFYIVPVVNPDGYEHSWSTYRLWRKNRRVNGGGEFGVDLNRNWDIDWNGGESTSTSPSSDVYVGPTPFSEPETTALRDFFLARPNIVAHIDFHSYSQIILYAWGYTNTAPPDDAVQDALARSMHDAALAVNGYDYPYGNGGDLIYLASGTCSDWTYDNGAAGMTIELRPDCCTFELPPAQIVPTGQEMFATAMAMADWASSPLGLIFPAGEPTQVPPDQPYTFSVQLDARQGDTLDTGSASLFTRIDSRGSFVESSLTHLGGSLYEGTLPAAPCGQRIEYYIQIDTSDNDTLSVPVDAPTTTLVADALERFYALNDNFESDLGWTTETLGASSGQWQRGVPVNDSSWSYDPTADGDGSGSCWLTGNALGNTDVDNGAVRLHSPAIDMTGAQPGEQWVLRYLYYLYLTDASSTDALVLEGSSNGSAGPWVELVRHDTHGGISWHAVEVTESDMLTAGLTFTDTMQFRFTASDDNPQSIVEAGVDGFTVDRAGCDDPVLPGDIAKPFGVVDVFDLLELLNNWGTSGPGADIAAPLDVVDVFDLLELLNNWS